MAYICDRVRIFLFAIKRVHIKFSLGLVYHAHHRPLSTPAAVLLDLSATLHSKLPPTVPTPSNVLRTLGTAFSLPSSLDAIANALTIPPIHVDHVAEAICVVLNSSANPIRGVIGVQQMRELIGWSAEGAGEIRVGLGR